jgi:Domain of unknown function (DUF222)
VSRILGHSYDALTTPERLNLLERLERETRRLRAPGHELINQLAEQAGPEELGGRLSHALADPLRITRGEAADLGPRRRLTGEVPAPRLAATAAARRGGDIGAGHVAVIRRFVNQLPSPVDLDTPERAEQHLACATPRTTHRCWTAHPPRTPRGATPAATRSATTMGSMRHTKHRTASFRKATGAACTAWYPPPPNRLQTPARATSCRRPVQTWQCRSRPRV